MRLKTFMPNVTLPLSSTSSVAGGSVSGPSEPKKRREGVNTVDQVFNKEARNELD